jgi:outer membrane protein assembly factor BamD (BamD/ComL family)
MYNTIRKREGKPNKPERKKEMELLLNKLNELYAESLRLMKEGKWEEANEISAEISKLSAEIHEKRLF